MASISLRDAASSLGKESRYNLDYHDYKSKQLLEFLADSLVAEAGIEGWIEDLGTNGCCQGDNSSIGQVPCIMGIKDA